MKAAGLILALLVSAAAAAGQEKETVRKQPAKKMQAAHAKATPEQIRKFNQLQKKQQQKRDR